MHLSSRDRKSVEWTHVQRRMGAARRSPIHREDSASQSRRPHTAHTSPPRPALPLAPARRRNRASRATPRHHASNRGLAPLDLVPLGLPDGGGRATTFCAAAAGASRKLRPLRRFVPGSCDSIRSTRVRSSPIECWISPSLVSTRSSCDLLPRPPLGGLGEDLEDEPREKKPRLLVLERLRAVERAIQRAEAERFTCQISTRSEVRGQRSEAGSVK